VWLRQTGEMRAAPKAPWRPFTAEQVICVHQPGFAWLARMYVAPLLSADILDCYVDGKGLLEARLFGSLPLARLAGSEASRGELMRSHSNRGGGKLVIGRRSVRILARQRDGLSDEVIVGLRSIKPHFDLDQCCRR
jgi:hypothetical protein